MTDICRICAADDVNGIDFHKWVRPTFTDHDKLVDGNIICDKCLFWFDESSTDLASRLGKESPQRMRNYSHFVVNGEWIPLGKGDKERMKELLLGAPFPELAAIAESEQKHIVFRATWNPRGADAGWVQFEEQSLFVKPDELRKLLDIIELLYREFTKKEIETGVYKSHRIRKFGIEEWYALESQLRVVRSSSLFFLALFLSQKREENDTRS